MGEPARHALGQEGDEPTLRIVLPSGPPPELFQPDPEFRRLVPGEVLAGRYRILELVGSGGMGTVFRAFDEPLGITIALKVLRPQPGEHRRAERQLLVERFRQELTLARQVTHKNVVRIHDIGQDGELLFLTMDFVAGRSLRELLAAEGPLEPERAAGIARQIALGLEAAHEAGVVHRDLKPANVLIDGAGQAYIGDFGVARSLNAQGLTRSGTMIGTLAYLSPEQARGDKVDGRSDLYALGILLFELLTGELPFAGGSATEMLAQRLTGASRDLTTLRSDVPHYLIAAGRRLLERDPARRYRSARELIDDLDRHSARPFPAWKAWRKWKPPVRAFVPLALAALLAAPWAFYLRGDGRATVNAARNPAEPRHEVAVLPLVDETGRADLAWVSTGVAQMLAAALGESPALRVIDTERVFRTLEDLRLPQGVLTAAEMGRLAGVLDADRLIAGRVRSVDGRLRVDLDLIASDLAGLPATSLHAERPSVGEIFALTEGLGRALRERLEVEPPAAAAVDTASPVALRAYSEGVGHLMRGDGLAAAPALERAVAADPDFTAAWVRLARAREGLGRQREALEAARRAVETLGRRPATRIAYEAQALEARLRGETGEAREILSKLVERYPQDTEARIELAETYGAQGDLKAAVAALEPVAEADPNHPRAWFLLARYAVLAGDSRRAVDEYLVRAMVIQNKLGSEQGQADVWNAMGVAYREMGDLGGAAENYEKAAEIRGRIGDARGYAATLRNLAAVDTTRGDHKQARQRLDKALGILLRLGDPAELADLYNDFGLLAEEQGLYQEAIAQYRRALQLRRETGDSLALAESLNNVGYAYYLLGRFDDAMVYCNQALDLYRQGGDRAGVIVVTQSLGLLQLAQGDWDLSLKSFLEALRSSRELDFKEATASSLGHIGRVAALQGRFRTALASYAEALAVMGELEDVRGGAEFTLAQAEADLELGLLGPAQERLDAVERLLTNGRNHEQQAELLRLRGEWHLRRGEDDRARELLRRAVAEAEASHGLVALLQARLSLAGVEKSTELAELRSLRAEIEPLGHRPLRLRAAEALAGAALAAGPLDEAEKAARQGLELARDCGTYAGAYRLHLLLAQALEQRGDAAGAALERSAAAAEIARLRRDLTPDQQRALVTPPRSLAPSGSASLEPGP